MIAQTVPSSPLKDSSLSSGPPGVARAVAIPDARSARDPQGHFLQPFRVAAVRYAATCGKSQRAAALDMGISDKTLSVWVNDARPDADGVVDVARFDELAQLRARVRLQDDQLRRITAERDFLKKCASYFASPASGGSK